MTAGYYSKFEEFFNKHSLELSKSRDDTVVILDTNILLDFYRNSSETNKEILNTLRKVSRELWIPHQVMLEFFYNKTAVKYSMESEFENAQKKIEAENNSLKNNLQDVINNLQVTSTDLIKKRNLLLEKQIKKIKAENNSLKKDLAEIKKAINSDDRYIEQFLKMVNGNIGDPYDQAKIDEIEEEGRKRFENKMPPGYMDDKKDEKRYFRGVFYKKKFGDLIIWNQIIDYVESKKNIKNVVFITNDNKEDWIYKTNGKRVGPRIELISEMIFKGEAKLIIMNINQFMSQVTQKKQKLIDDSNKIDRNSKRVWSINRIREINNLENVLEKQNEELDAIKYRGRLLQGKIDKMDINDEKNNYSPDMSNDYAEHRDFLIKRLQENMQKESNLKFEIRNLKERIEQEKIFYEDRI